jgi:hypothetical protein
VRALFDFPVAGVAERGDSPRDPSSVWLGATVRPTSFRDARFRRHPGSRNLDRSQKVSFFRSVASGICHAKR